MFLKVFLGLNFELTYRFNCDIINYDKLTTKAQTIAIKKASKALSEAESAWAKKYWFKVWKDLCLKYKRTIN